MRACRTLCQIPARSNLRLSLFYVGATPTGSGRNLSAANVTLPRNILSDGEKPSSLGAVLRINIMEGNLSTQFSLRSTPIHLKDCFSVRWNRSIIPFDCGWAGVDLFSVILLFFKNWRNSQDMKFLPWSAMSTSGHPKCCNQPCLKALMVSFVVGSLIGKAAG